MKFKESLKEHYACVYCITYPDGMKYVGQTKDLGGRVNMYYKMVNDGLFDKSGKNVLALKEIGIDNCDITPIVKVPNLDGDDLVLCLSILEIKYIRQYNTIENGYNVSIGGEIFGIPCDYYNTDFSSQRVLCYDIDGNLVHDFSSIERCAYELGVDSKAISSSLNRRRELFYGKYMLRKGQKGEAPKQILPFKRNVITKQQTVVQKVYEKEIIHKKVVKEVVGKDVLMYDSNGDFEQKFDSCASAARYLHMSSISTHRIVKGHYFIPYNGENIEEHIDNLVLKSANRRKPKFAEDAKMYDENDNVIGSGGWSSLINDFAVSKYDLNGNIIDTYPSIKMAAYETGIAYSGIWANVFGRTRKTHGYIFRRAE